MVGMCSGEGVHLSNQKCTLIQEQGMVMVNGILPSPNEGERLSGPTEGPGTCALEA